MLFYVAIVILVPADKEALCGGHCRGRKRLIQIEMTGEIL